LGYENIEQMRQGSLAASRNRSIIVALENTISLVTEAESGQRGYLITGEPEYLEPYREILGPSRFRGRNHRVYGARV